MQGGFFPPVWQIILCLPKKLKVANDESRISAVRRWYDKSSLIFFLAFFAPISGEGEKREKISGFHKTCWRVGYGIEPGAE